MTIPHEVGHPLVVSMAAMPLVPVLATHASGGMANPLGVNVTTEPVDRDCPR